MKVVEGPIGVKLNRLHDLLREIGRSRRGPTREFPKLDRPLYFLPDWDDFIDVDYDFETDTFSSEHRSSRHEEHSITLMRPQRLCDGVLVSLAQNLGTKGLLRRVGSSDPGSLAPRPVRQHFKLCADQWAFGDWGGWRLRRCGNSALMRRATCPWTTRSRPSLSTTGCSNVPNSRTTS
jgi:hypothetical protein